MFSTVEAVERMTAEDFFRDAPENQKAELIEGVMVMPPPPMDSHERLMLFLVRLVAEFVEVCDLGEVRGSRTAVQLSDDFVVEPDILFVAKERAEIIGPRGVFGPPDLVIEILSVSTARYDRGSKLRAYERAGVLEYWVIDPYGPDGTQFFRREQERFLRVEPDADGRLFSVALEGFWLDVAWLWPSGRFVSIRDALSRILA
jgi:Uma2 family endonuclease